jgi:EmrB/QacA subfamily drug resistance transporter
MTTPHREACVNRTTTTTVRAQRWVLILTSAASLMVALDQLVVATALTTIRHDLHASLATVEWTVNAYSLSFAVLLITGAALGDRLGRRRVLVSGLTLFALASAACALAPSAGWLIAARTIQGAGSALVMPAAMALLTAAYPPEKRGAALGIFAALTGLAVVGGPVLGGAITQGLAWQWVFWVNVPLAVIVIPLVRAKVAENCGGRTGIDVAGIVLVGAAMLCLVWGLSQANTVGWASAEVIGTLAGAAVLTASFVLWELRADNPMVPMQFFRVRAFSAGNAAALLLYGSLYSSVFFVSQYLQVSLAYSPLAAGLRVMPWAIGVLVIAPLAGRLTDRIGARLLVVAGLTLQGLGLAWLSLNASDHRHYAASIVALIVSGCGTSMAMPSVQNAVMNSVPRSALGKAAGTFSTLRQLGGALGIAVLAAVFAAHGSYRSARAFSDGFAPAIAGAAAFALVGAVIGLATPGRRRAAVPQPRPEPEVRTEYNDTAAAGVS